MNAACQSLRPLVLTRDRTRHHRGLPVGLNGRRAIRRPAPTRQQFAVTAQHAIRRCRDQEMRIDLFDVTQHVELRRAGLGQRRRATCAAGRNGPAWRWLPCPETLPFPPRASAPP